MNTTIHRLIVDDWAPYIEKAVRVIAIPIAAAYVAGLMFGIWLHQLNNALAQLTSPLQAAAPAAAAPAPIKVQRFASEPMLARSEGGLGMTPQTDMDRAVLAVLGGMSQAAAARRYNVSRSTLRRRLKDL